MKGPRDFRLDSVFRGQVGRQNYILSSKAACKQDYTRLCAIQMYAASGWHWFTAGVPFVTTGTAHMQVLSASHWPCSPGLKHPQGNIASCIKAVVSGYPITRFRFCIACPDAPLTRLSITLMTMALPGSRSSNTFIKQKLVPRTCRV